MEKKRKQLVDAWYDILLFQERLALSELTVTPGGRIDVQANEQINMNVQKSKKTNVIGKQTPKQNDDV